MKKFLVLALAVLAASPVIAQTSNVRLVGNDPTGLQRPVPVGTDGRLLTSNGATYNATPPTYTDGQSGTPQINSKGSTIVTAGNGFTNGDALTNVTLGMFDLSNTIRSLSVYPSVYNGATWDRQRGDTNGAYMIQKGGNNIATAQVSIGTSSTLVAAARAGRQRITVAIAAANTCAFGNSGVTTTTGFALQPTAGASLTLDTNAALYAACSATTTVNVLEQY